MNFVAKLGELSKIYWPVYNSYKLVSLNGVGPLLAKTEMII